MSENEAKRKEMIEQLNAVDDKEKSEDNGDGKGDKKTDNKVDKKAGNKADSKNDGKPLTNGDGHVLTEAESKRQKLFDENEKKLLAKGYKRHDLIISVLTANVVGVLLTLPFIAVEVAFFLLRNGVPNFDQVLDENPVLFFVMLGVIVVSMVVLAVVHEKIHGWFWAIGAENGSKDIEFGFQKENLTPYCTCKSPLSKPLYILGSMMPMTIIGIIPGIVSIFIGNVVVLIIAALQIMGGAGDILISSMLLFHKTKGKDVILLDHPTKIGLVVYEKE